MKELIKRTKILWLLIIAISFVGCENDDDANLPELIASFAHTINEDTGAVSFINLSENADTYTWDFGDGNTSSEINPIRSFPTGTYMVKLTAKNAAGASGTFEDQLVINIPLPINVPVTFDDPNVNYEVTTFNGASFAIVDNPDASGSNTSTSKVGAITNSGAAFEGLFFDLGMGLDLTTLKSVKANFWSDTAVNVLLKLEKGTGADIETVASHSGTGWEMITFNFTSDASYSRFTLFVDGPGTTPGTFYIDDIEQIETPPATSGCAGTTVAATALPLDFEGCATFPSADNFGSGIASELAQNPSKTGINTSDFALKVDKPTGSDFFAGIQNTFESNFDLTTTDVFKLKVYSTKANVVFRFELLANPNDGSIGNPAPVFITIPTADEWTEIEVTFTGLPAGPMAYNQLVIKPDNDQSDSAITEGGTYYIDDLELTDGGGSSNAPTVAAPTPSQDAADVISVFSGSYTDVSGTDFNPDWGQATVVTNETIAGDDTMLYTGLNYQGIALGSAQDASGMEFLHIDYWTANSTALNAFLISSGPVETAKALTVPTGGGWTSVDIPLGDFSPVDLADVIQMKFDGNGDIYLDNIYFYKSGPTSSGCSSTPIAATAFPVTFETCETFLSTFTDSGSITTELADNPSKTGINTTDYVLKVVKATGSNRWAGFQNPFPSNFDATKTFKVKIYSSKANVVMKFEVNSDPQPPASGNPGPQYVTITDANTWTEVEITFTGIPGNNTGLNQLVIKPDNPDGSDGELTSSEETYYIDDIRLE